MKTANQKTGLNRSLGVALGLVLFFHAPGRVSMFAELAVTPPTAGALKAAFDYSKEHRGQSFVVLFEGGVIAEMYANGGAAGNLQMLASGSKSFVGAAAAAAVADGLIRLDDPASGSLVEWKGDPLKSKITYRELLTLTSGLPASGRSVRGVQPAWKESAAAAMSGEPGQQFQYGASQLNVFALALQQVLGTESFEAYLKRRILDPLGVKVEWRVRCADGNPQVGGGGFCTARDWARFGEFVRLGGAFEGRQIVPTAPLAECFEGTEANPAYGQTWWLKRNVSPALVRQNVILRSEWADVANAGDLPGDLVAACGAGKQRLYVIPSRRLVIVRQGGFAARGFSDGEFLRRVLGPSKGDR